jgi:hypothetical protein
VTVAAEKVDIAEVAGTDKVVAEHCTDTDKGVDMDRNWEVGMRNLKVEEADYKEEGIYTDYHKGNYPFNDQISNNNKKSNFLPQCQ